jgi:hypothetical protein
MLASPAGIVFVPPGAAASPAGTLLGTSGGGDERRAIRD